MTKKENNEENNSALEINNVSYHEFFMPFYIKENKDNENGKKIICEHWEKVNDDNRFYFKVENDNSLANKNQRYGIKCSKNTYFNESAKKLLGLTENEEYVTYNRKKLADFKLLIEKGDYKYNLDVLNVMLYKTQFNTFLLRITTKYNHQNDTKDDILSAFNRINDYGRRIYLSNVSDYSDENKSQSLYTASKMSLYNVDKTVTVTAEFRPEYKEIKNYASEIINYLLFNDEKTNLTINSCLDDRMFVCATLADGKGFLNFKKNSDYICHLSNNIELESIREKIDEKLYKTIFVDGESCSCYDKYKRNKDIADVIYTRWMPYSLYAITDYSYLHLTGKIASDCYYLIDNDINIYGDMAALSLLQRSTTLYVSNSLDNEDNMNDNIVNLMKDINIMEASEQIQGIEMYDMFKKKMNLKRNVELLNGQLSAIHERDHEIVEDNLNHIMLVLTIISILDSVSIGAVKACVDSIATIATILLKKEAQTPINLIGIAYFVTIVIYVLIYFGVYKIISNKKYPRKYRRKAIKFAKALVIIVMAIKLLLPQ